MTRGKSYGETCVAEQTMPEPDVMRRDDERAVAETQYPFQRGYDCNLESGDIVYSKIRTKQFLTTQLR